VISGFGVSAEPGQFLGMKSISIHFAIKPGLKIIPCFM